jgi:NAD(P)-dependent dehydrogenase (short-subunit alcohol dehydrogenase family)
VGRNPSKTEATLHEIKLQSGNASVDMLLGDLSSMADVRRIAADFKRKHQRLDVLVNNAGAWFAARQETVDGYEMTFALNHLSYFLLTNLLLDVLKASAPARIVNVSSDAHTTAPLNFDDLQHKKSYEGRGFIAYGQSKLANVLFTYELARRLQGTGVTANVLHPGFVATGFGINNGGLMRLGMKIAHLFAIDEEKGAQTMFHLATSPEVEGISGKYWDKSKAVSSSRASYDETAQRRLWEISEQMTGLTVAR